jgi:AraC family transcriptional regulator
MEPTIVDKAQIILLGLGFFGDPFASSGGWTEENEIGRLWGRFMVYLEHNGDRIRHVKDSTVSYEVHIWDEEAASRGHFEVFVGLEVEELEDVPVEVVAKILPPTKYAVFTLRGEQITSDWPKMIYEDWMARSGYQEAHRYLIQAYDQRFKGLHDLEESELDIYVPIKEMGG